MLFTYIVVSMLLYYSLSRLFQHLYYLHIIYLTLPLMYNIYLERKEIIFKGKNNQLNEYDKDIFINFI